MKYFAGVLLLTLIFISQPLTAQNSSDTYQLDFTLLEEREAYKEELLNEKILHNLSYPLNQDNEQKWMEAFWAAQFTIYRGIEVENALRTGFHNFFERSTSFQRALLEAAYSLYPDRFLDEATSLIDSLSDSKLYAMAVLYAARTAPQFADELKKHLENNFAHLEDDPILTMLRYEVTMAASGRQEVIPPPADLLGYPVQKHHTVIFSIQRKNRNHSGLVVIRKPDGTFLRNEDGSFFHVSQLTRAITGLPGYITNGNTPEGIFSLQDVYKSEVDFIGPTPSLKLILPFEEGPDAFFHNSYLRDLHFSEKVYHELLPQSWRDYMPVYEAYYAGKAGRYDIVMHGTTIDPSFYSGQPYYPNTPSLGCLCTYEEWSPETGERIKSNQQKLMDAYLSVGKRKGFAVVFNIDNKEAPVTIEEIIPYLKKAEKKNPWH